MPYCLQTEKRKRKSVNGQVLSKNPSLSWNWQLIEAVRYPRRERWLCQEHFMNMDGKLCLTSKLEGIFRIGLIGCESCNSRPTQAHLYTWKSDTNYPVDKTRINAFLPFLLKRKKNSFKLVSELSTRRGFLYSVYSRTLLLSSSFLPISQEHVLAQSLSLKLAGPPKRRNTEWVLTDTNNTSLFKETSFFVTSKRIRRKYGENKGQTTRRAVLGQKWLTWECSNNPRPSNSLTSLLQWWAQFPSSSPS